MKKQFSYLVITIAATLFLTSVSFDLMSQCSNCGSNYPSGFVTTTSASWTTRTTCNYGGEYSYYTLNSGYIYQWMTCGDTDFDTQLTLYPSSTCANTSTTWHPGPYLLAYNDDACGMQSVLNYSPGITSVRVLMSQYPCQSNSTCMTLKWRAIPKTPTISGGGTICNGQSINLTASNIGNNDSYVSVYWGTTSGGTQVSSDATTVNVSPTTTTTYYLRYVLTGDNFTYSNIASTTVTVRQPPTAPTGLSIATNPICAGSSVNLTATGGSVGSGCTYQWYSGSCGGTAVSGSGSTINVSPTTTTTYYVRRVGNSPCNSTVTSCASGTLTVKSVSVVPSSINTQINP